MDDQIMEVMQQDKEVTEVTEVTEVNIPIDEEEDDTVEDTTSFMLGTYRCQSYKPYTCTNVNATVHIRKPIPSIPPKNLSRQEKDPVPAK